MILLLRMMTLEAVTPDVTSIVTSTPRPTITRLPISSPTPLVVEPTSVAISLSTTRLSISSPTSLVVEPTSAAISPSTAVVPVSPAQLVIPTPPVGSPTMIAVPERTSAGSHQQAQSLILVAKGFGAGEGAIALGYSFLVDNPNAALAAKNTSFQVAAFDAAGDVVATDQNYITLILPGERRGIGGHFYLPKGKTVARIDVQLQPKDFTASSTSATFTTERALFIPDKIFPKVTGIIHSPFKQDMNQVSVSAVPFDANGNIIGGGFGLVDFIPAGGQTAVELLVETSGVPARVELYAGITVFTLPSLQ